MNLGDIWQQIISFVAGVLMTIIPSLQPPPIVPNTPSLQTIAIPVVLQSSTTTAIAVGSTTTEPDVTATPNSSKNTENVVPIVHPSAGALKNPEAVKAAEDQLVSCASNNGSSTSFEKELCYAQVAEQLGDLDLCINSGQAFTCLGVIPVRSLSSCGSSSLSALDQSMCTREYALTSHNPSVCAEISTSSLDHDLCYQNLAIQSKDSSICSGMSSGGQLCVQEVQDSIQNPSNYMENDPSVCTSPSSAVPPDECFEIVAINSQNSSICDKIVDPETKQISTLR